MKLGIIGLGKIAISTYLPLLSEFPEIDEVYAFTPNKETLAQLSKQYHLIAKPSVEELLSSVDCCWIHSATTSHYSIAKQALEAKIPVYIDKPLAEEIKDAKKLLQLSKQNNTLLKVGYNRRYAPEYVKLKALIKEHPLHALNIEKHRSEPTKEHYSITILDDFIHLVDTLNWLTDGTFSIKNVIGQRNEQNELLNLTVYYQHQEKVATISTHRTSQVDFEKVTAFIDGQQIEITDMYQTQITNEQGKLIEPISLRALDAHRRGFVPMLQEFLIKVKNEDTGFIDDQQYRAQELVEKIIKQIVKQ